MYMMCVLGVCEVCEVYGRCMGGVLGVLGVWEICVGE